MNSLTSYVQSAALAALAGTGSFIHDSPELATLKLNSAQLPAIIYGEPVLKQSDSQARGITATVTIFFASTTPGLGDDYDASLQTIATMQLLCNQFLAILDGPMALTKVENITRGDLFKVYEAVLDGVTCQFTLTVPVAPLVVRCLPGAAPVITNFTAVGA